MHLVLTLARTRGRARPDIFRGRRRSRGYAFEPFDGKAPVGGAPAKLKRVWRFDFDPTAPKGDIHRYLNNRREGPSNIYGMPVFDNGRLYVAGGGDIFWGKLGAWIKCLDPSKSGDTTESGGTQVWSHPLERHVMSTPAVHDGLVFIPDCGRNVLCLDAKTGETIWKRGIQGDVWSSPLVADGKVYVGSRSGQLMVFSADREGKVLSTVDCGAPISGTPTAANGVLYIPRPAASALRRGGDRFHAPPSENK